MQYQTNELNLTLPEVVQDRSVNVLLFGTKQPPDFNLVISREFLPKGEKFDYIVKKQLDVIAGSQKDFKLIGPERERTIAREDGSTVAARESTVTYKSNGTKFVQRHLYIPLDGQRILILTGTVTSAWESPDDARWDKLANSIRLK